MPIFAYGFLWASAAVSCSPAPCLRVPCFAAPFLGAWPSLYPRPAVALWASGLNALYGIALSYLFLSPIATSLPLGSGGTFLRPLAQTCARPLPKWLLLKSVWPTAPLTVAVFRGAPHCTGAVVSDPVLFFSPSRCSLGPCFVRMAPKLYLLPLAAAKRHVTFFT